VGGVRGKRRDMCLWRLTFTSLASLSRTCVGQGGWGHGVPEGGGGVLQCNGGVGKGHILWVC
jgi:hypothetical protein